MFRIMKFAKKRWYIMLVIIALLIGQAMCELTLPTYTSNIVNVGLTYKGIEYAVPEQIREASYMGLVSMMPEDMQKLMADIYEKDGDIYRVDYKDIDKETMDILSDAFLDAELAMMKFQAQQMLAAGKEIENENMAMLAKMDDKDLAEFKDSYGEAIAISFVRQEYEALGVDLDAHQMSYLKRYAMKMMGLSLGCMIFAILVTLVAARMAAMTSKELRESIFKKVVSFSNEEMNRFSTASLITRCTNDVQQIQMFMIMMFRMVLYAPIMGIGGIIRVAQTDGSMSWIIVLAVVLLFGLVIILMTAVMPKFKIMQSLVDRVNLVAREILTGIPVIRAFSREKYEEQRFDVANTDLMQTQLFTSRMMAFMMPCMMFIMNGVSILIIWVGAHGIDSGNIMVGDMMAFITYTMQIIMSFLMITMISIMLPRASVAAERIDEVLNSETLITDCENPEEMGHSGEISFEHVNFAYPGAEEDVLHDITFTAHAGKTTAFIGSTGSGKSTLVQLIPRLFDVTGGAIKIDGTDIRKLRLNDLRRQIGFVPQKGVLFSGTIDSNLRFGAEDATPEQIEKAARIAQALEFIETKPDKYETEIAQGGNNVSGGQKQRLAIARALAKEAGIYIFDDSFSALDFKTDAALRKALSREVAGATVLIVAQRISTILHADQIIVLDEGRIVGKGTHKELLANNQVYQEIAQSQLSQKELEGEVE